MDFTGKDLMLASKMKGSPQDYSERLWIAQPKWDGQRMAVRRNGEHVAFVQRSQVRMYIDGWINKSWFPEQDFVVDGEWLPRDHVYVVFDLLEWEGVDLRSVRLEDRLALLHEHEDKFTYTDHRPVVTVTPHGEPDVMMGIVKKFNMEGVVVKRRDSQYVSGRSNTWQKFVQEQTARWTFWHVPGSDRVEISVMHGGTHGVAITEQQRRDIEENRPTDGKGYTGEFRFWGWQNRMRPNPRYPKFVRLMEPSSNFRQASPDRSSLLD